MLLNFQECAFFQMLKELLFYLNKTLYYLCNVLCTVSTQKKKKDKYTTKQAKPCDHHFIVLMLITWLSTSMIGSRSLLRTGAVSDTIMHSVGCYLLNWKWQINVISAWGIKKCDTTDHRCKSVKVSKIIA